MKLTKPAIDRMVYEKEGGKPDIRWDDSLPGFGIRIYPSNKKSFVVFYRHSGEQRLWAFDKYGIITLEQAKKKAKKYIANADEKDPMAERQSKRRGKTVGDLVTDYIELHAKPHKTSWEKDEQRLQRHILPIWKNRMVKSIKPQDAAILFHDIGGKAPYEANRLRSLARKMFSLAIDWGYLSEVAVNPFSKLAKYKEEKRDRWVTPEELPRLAKAIDEDENLYARNALWLYLLTGLRKNELLRAKWDDIDWPRKELRIPETKADRVHYIPLSSPALALLEKLPKCDDNSYLFPGSVEGRPLVNIDKAWARIKKSAQVEDVRIHDLRRTVGSWLAQSGNSLHLIGRILNQTTPSTTAIYARFAQDNIREALEAHGEKIMSVAKNEKGDVVRMGKDNG